MNRCERTNRIINFKLSKQQSRDTSRMRYAATRHYFADWRWVKNRIETGASNRWIVIKKKKKKKDRERRDPLICVAGNNETASNRVKIRRIENLDILELLRRLIYFLFSFIYLRFTSFRLIVDLKKTF